MAGATAALVQGIHAQEPMMWSLWKACRHDIVHLIYTLYLSNTGYKTTLGSLCVCIYYYYNLPGGIDYLNGLSLLAHFTVLVVCEGLTTEN